MGIYLGSQQIGGGSQLPSGDNGDVLTYTDGQWAAAPPAASGGPSLWRGVWSSEETYEVGEFVVYNEAIYEALNVAENYEPDFDPAYWAVRVPAPAGNGNGNEFSTAHYVLETDESNSAPEPSSVALTLEGSSVYAVEGLAVLGVEAGQQAALNVSFIEDTADGSVFLDHDFIYGPDDRSYEVKSTNDQAASTAAVNSGLMGAETFPVRFRAHIITRVGMSSADLKLVYGDPLMMATTTLKAGTWMRAIKVGSVPDDEV